MIGASVVFYQVRYIQEKNLGFSKEQLVTLPIHTKAMSQSIETIKAELMQNPSIVGATACYGVPEGRFAGDGIKVPGHKEQFSTNMFLIDEDYIPTLGITMVAGRNFSKSFGGRQARVCALRIRSAATTTALSVLTKKWQAVASEWPFEYTFLDEQLADQYRSEQIFSKVVGLFGLAAFTAEQRTKEIGVRKVLGASVTSIVALQRLPDSSADYCAHCLVRHESLVGKLCLPG